jgi:hypothetical protein
MLSLDDIKKLKDILSEHNNRRISIEAEIKLIKKDMKEKYGVESIKEADEFIKELEIEKDKMEKELRKKLNALTEKMENDGLL